MGKLTVKFISQEAHMGSEEQSAIRLKSLSKAAGKFNAILNASIKEKARGVKESVAAAEAASANGERSAPNRTSESRKSTKVLTFEVETTPEEAVLIATTLFNGMEKQGNSEKYTAKKAAFDTAKRQTLAEFSVKSYSDISEDEKQEYAKRMIALKAPFDYTERTIHIKYEGCSTVYSKSSRFCGIAHWPSNIYEKLINLEKLKGKYTVRFREPESSK